MTTVKAFKKLTVAIATALSALCVTAATCEGITKTGERCKREAAEGSKYCIGHADQAKTAAKADSAKEPKAKEGKAKAHKAKADKADKTPKAEKADKVAKEKADKEPKAKEGKAKAHKAKADKTTKVKADVEKSATALKDDGTCWAVTEAGTRCKHKKDGNSDYCKQHGPDVKAKKPLDRCRALKWDGERCSRRPEEGYMYCAQHRKLGVAAEKSK